MALSPGGIVPTPIHGDTVLVESRLITEYLEKGFLRFPLLPARAAARYDVRRWTKLFDDRLQLAVFILSFVGWMRPRHLEMPEDVRNITLPGLAEPLKQRVAENLLFKGWSSELVPTALEQLADTVEQIDRVLVDTRWMCVDLLLGLYRMEDLGFASL